MRVSPDSLFVECRSSANPCTIDSGNLPVAHDFYHTIPRTSKGQFLLQWECAARSERENSAYLYAGNLRRISIGKKFFMRVPLLTSFKIPSWPCALSPWPGTANVLHRKVLWGPAWLKNQKARLSTGLRGEKSFWANARMARETLLQSAVYESLPRRVKK